MVKNGIHHCLVGDKNDKIIGIVSSLDVAREFVEDSNFFKIILEHDIIRKLFSIPKQQQNSFNDKMDEFFKELNYELFWDRNSPDFNKT